MRESTKERRSASARPNQHTAISNEEPSGRVVSEVITGQRLTLTTRALRSSISWISVALLLLLVVFGGMAPSSFLTGSNFTNLGDDAAILLIVSVGQTFVIIQNGIDLSMSSVLVFSGVIAGYVMLAFGGQQQGWATIILGLVTGLVVGMAWGVLNGFVVAKAKVPALIATLGTFGGVLGLADVITGGVDLRALPVRLTTDLGIDTVLGIPWLVVVAVVVAVVGAFVLHLTAFGQRTFAIGSNSTSARRAGIKVDRHIIVIYGMAGLLSGLAGDLSLAQFGTTSLAGNSEVLLGSVTAVVLGGASLFGGSGNMLGTVIGVMIPVVLANGLVIVGVSSYWQAVATGMILVLAVYVDQQRRAKLARSER